MNLLDYRTHITDDPADFKVFKRGGRDRERSNIKIFLFYFWTQLSR